MPEKLDLSNLEKINDQLFDFIWTFKVGDNIMYNFKVLRELYFAKDNSNTTALNKPITITIVSIIEAILVDFIRRLGEATRHQPSNISPDKLRKIQSRIRKESLKDGERYKRRLYNYSKIIKRFKKYELFGPKDDEIYEHLTKFGQMRNRVHIENYYENFEEDEGKVFTDIRLETLETILFQLWEKMVSDYKRPWKKI